MRKIKEKMVKQRSYSSRMMEIDHELLFSIQVKFPAFHGGRFFKVEESISVCLIIEFPFHLQFPANVWYLITVHFRACYSGAMQVYAVSLELEVAPKYGLHTHIRKYKWNRERCLIWRSRQLGWLPDFWKLFFCSQWTPFMLLDILTWWLKTGAHESPLRRHLSLRVDLCILCPILPLANPLFVQ